MSATINTTMLWASGAALAGVSSTCVPGTAAMGLDAYENTALREAVSHPFPAPCFARENGGAAARNADQSQRISLRVLIEQLGSEDNAVHKRNREQLCALREQALHPLIKTLREHANERIRARAAMMLSTIARNHPISPRRIGTIVKALLHAVHSDPSEEVAGNAALALGYMGHDGRLSPAHRAATIPALSQIVQSKGPHIIRLKAISALRNMGAEQALAGIRDEAVQVAIRALNDEAPFTRSWAASVLHDLEDARSVPALVEATKNTDDACYAMSIRALCRIGGARAAPTLVHTLGAEHLYLSQEAWRALSKMGHEAVDALLAGLRHDNSFVRQLSALLLGETHSGRALAPLLQLLHESHGADLRCALQAIAVLGDKRALPPLRTFFEIVADNEERRMVAEIIERLGADAERMLDEHTGTSERAARDIALTLKAKLGLASSIDVFLSRLEDAIGMMTPGGGAWELAALSCALGFAHRADLLPPDALVSIEHGENKEQALAMMKTLNYLVHHEIAHLLQRERSIPEPAIDAARFGRFDPERVKLMANEMLIDKLALDMARTLYVGGGGDALFDEDQREAIAIASSLALFRITFPHHDTEEQSSNIQREVSAENVALMLEMAESDAISEKTRKALEALAGQYEISAWGGEDKDFILEFKDLIFAYRAIYAHTRLERWL